jgi:hypothetical protein
MRKLIISFICFLAVSTSYSKAFSNKLESKANERKLYQNVSTQENDIAVYRLFKTQNMWNFIKLNTRTGQMWQIQFDVPGDNRGVTYLNLLPLVPKEKEVDGRFTLYSTENIHTFILLDQLEGKTWQVQWSIEPKDRFVLPID